MLGKIFYLNTIHYKVLVWVQSSNSLQNFGESQKFRFNKKLKWRLNFVKHEQLLLAIMRFILKWMKCFSLN